MLNWASSKLDSDSPSLLISGHSLRLAFLAGGGFQIGVRRMRRFFAIGLTNLAVESCSILNTMGFGFRSGELAQIPENNPYATRVTWSEPHRN